MILLLVVVHKGLLLGGAWMLGLAGLVVVWGCLYNLAFVVVVVVIVVLVFVGDLVRG